jgi:hypothetical protein
MKPVRYRVIFEYPKAHEHYEIEGHIGSMILEVQDGWIVSVVDEYDPPYCLQRCKPETFPFTPSDYLFVMPESDLTEDQFELSTYFEKLYYEVRMERRKRLDALEESIRELESKRANTYNNNFINPTEQALMQFGIPDPRLLGYD